MGQIKKLTLFISSVGFLTLPTFAQSSGTEAQSNFLSSGKSKPAPQDTSSTPTASFTYKALKGKKQDTELGPEYFQLPEDRLGIDQRMSYEINFGLGRPGNTALSGWSWNWALSAHYFLLSDFDFSIFVRQSKAKGIDNVVFDTSFTEKRVYSIGVNMAGVGARLRVLGEHTFEVRSGISQTSSVLSEITADAPTGPALEVGYSKSIPRGIPLDLIYAYEWRGPRGGAAAVLSFTQSSLGKNESTAEIALGVALRYYSVPWELRAVEK